MTTELEQALNIILSQPASDGLIEYAKTYAKACFNLGNAEEADIKETEAILSINEKPTENAMIDQELKTQLLYVLSNLGGWRGETARSTKAIIKKYTK